MSLKHLTIFALTLLLSISVVAQTPATGVMLSEQSATPKHFDGRCPVCLAQGKKSTVTVGSSTGTLMASPTYYDENGVYHNDDPNTYTTEYSCSSGHHFSVGRSGNSETIKVTDDQPANVRYSFKRSVTITDKKGHKLTRQSTFTFNDKGESVEVSISQSGNLRVDSKTWQRMPNAEVNGHGLDGFDVLYTDERGIEQTKDSPWFAEEGLSGMMFPVSATAVEKNFRVEIRYFDWRLFRTSVVIREVEQ